MAQAPRLFVLSKVKLFPSEKSSKRGDDHRDYHVNKDGKHVEIDGKHVNKGGNHVKRDGKHVNKNGNYMNKAERHVKRACTSTVR